MYKKFVIVMVIVIVCGACGNGTGNKNMGEDTSTADEMDIQAVNAIATSVNEKDGYEFYIETDKYKLSLYEPPKGCYKGAYILSNKAVGFDIEQFETLTDSKHALYMYNMGMKDYFPVNWVLSCIASSKTPYIVLKPSVGLVTGDEKELIKTAKAFGEFYVPMFVQLGTVDKTYDAEKYKAYFKRVREIFREYASNVAFVWSVGGSDAFNSSYYYPGDEWVDWVGIEVFDSLGEEDTYATDVMKEIEYFYYTFQQKKPIIVSKLAVSHFSSKDHIYRTTPAALEIGRFYDDLTEKYPRIKAVIYMDFNGIDIPGDKMIKEDFSITSNDNILRAYKNAVSSPNYLSELDVASTGDASKEIFKSPFAVYKVGDHFYISEKCFVYDLNIKGVGGYADSKEIDGQHYFDAEVLAKKNIGTLKVNEKTKTVVLQMKL